MQDRVPPSFPYPCPAVQLIVTLAYSIKQEADNAGLDWINDTNSGPQRGAPQHHAPAPLPNFATPARMTATDEENVIPVATAVPVSSSRMQR